MTAAHDKVWLGSGIQPTRICCLISATLLVYDHLCTLDREIELVWKRRLGSPATTLFFLNRYLPYFYVFSTIKDYWLIAQSQEECRNRDIGNLVPITINLFISELILTLRTLAIWDRRRDVSALFAVLWAVKVSLVLVSLSHMLHSAHYINISSTEIICISPVLGSWSWETLCFMLILIVETIVAAFTLTRTVQARRSSTSRWFFKILYMGIIYYFYTLLMTVANLVGTIYMHNMGNRAFGLLQGVLQSILCNRVIFLVRSPSELAIVSDDINTLSTLRINRAGWRRAATEDTF